MTELRNLDTNNRITRFVNLLADQEVLKVVHRTLDGQYYVQTIGGPASTVEIEVYIDVQGKALLLQAEAAANLLRVVSPKGVSQGRILERSAWSKVLFGWYKTTIKLGVVG